MRRVVLVDGENLNYAIRKMIGSSSKPASRAVLIGYNYRGLIDNVLENEQYDSVLFFGAKLRRYKHSEELSKKCEKAIHLQSILVNQLNKQGIQFIKAGYLRARETKSCKQCGDSRWALIEKGVDVALAVRIVEEAKKDTEIVVISADTDVLPAIKTAAVKGAKVTVVSYEDCVPLALVKNASLSRVITRNMVKKAAKHE